MHYSGYKVAILGFGVEGQDAACYFLGQKSIITVFDRSDRRQVISDKWEEERITWICGTDYLKDGLKGFDVIVRSPGVYRYLPEIVEAEKTGTKITSNTILFFEESEANIIGVTGTKGKGTTASMLQLGLENSGKSTLLLGNIGTPMLDRIDDADTFDWVILELSSFQLIDLPYSPPIAVVTNITVDHLNWHKDHREYVGSKENLWKHQKITDSVIFNWDDKTCRQLVKDAPGKVLWFTTETETGKGAYLQDDSVYLNKQQVGSRGELRVPGNHNVANSLAALVAGTIAGGQGQKVWKGIIRFEGRQHRLEKVATVDGVTFINDSAATTPEAAIAALQSFEQPKILIAGGSLKGVGFGEFAKAVVGAKVKAVFPIGEAAKQIETEIETEGFKGQVFCGIEDMNEIIKQAKSLAEPGDIILLSPACASFGLFRDYKDRGDAFKKAVLSV